MDRYQLFHRDTGEPILDEDGAPRFMWSDGEPEQPQAKTKPWEWRLSPPVPTSIAVRQLALGLLQAGHAADAMALGNRTIPPGLQPIVGQMPVEQQAAVLLTIQTMTEADRASPLIDVARAAYDWTDDEADDFFRAAAQL